MTDRRASATLHRARAVAGASYRAVQRIRGRLARGHPEPAEDALALTNDHLARDEADRALAAISDASHTSPTNEAIVRRHLQVARAHGNLPEWKTASDRLVEIVPTEPSVHLQRSVLANQTGDAFLFWRSLTAASQLFRERAVQGDPGALCGLLDTHRRLGKDDVDDLLRIVVAETQRRPTARVMNEAADTLVHQGDIIGLEFLADGIDQTKLDASGEVSMADLCIRLERNSEAEAIIATLGSSTKRQAELQAWSAVRQGNVDEARTLISAYSYPQTLDYMRIYNRNLALNLSAPTRVPPSDGPPAIVITMTKNERARLPEWFAHHRALGIERFLAIDNGSTDGTLAYLQAQPDTYVFQSASDFRRYASGRRWVNHLIDTYGKDCWCFVIDADELLVFPGDEGGIAHLLPRLDANDSQVMFGIALDMHAERLGAWDDHSDAPLQQRFPYFDTRTRVIGSRDAPYLAASGGLRNQKLGRIMPENLLSRPLAIRGGTGTHFLNPHATNPAKPAEVSAALLHYKFSMDPRERIGVPSAKGVYMQFLGHDLEGVRGIELLSSHTTRYENAAQLLDLGLLRDTSASE